MLFFLKLFVFRHFFLHENYKDQFTKFTIEKRDQQQNPVRYALCMIEKCILLPSLNTLCDRFSLFFTL
jgi:hypothetical protein